MRFDRDRLRRSGFLRSMEEERREAEIPSVRVITSADGRRVAVKEIFTLIYGAGEELRLLAPIEPVEGMPENGALVFRRVGAERLMPVRDQKRVAAVFAAYYDMIGRSGGAV